MNTTYLLLYVIAACCFVAAACNVTARINLVALGLLACVLVRVIATVRAS